jgi:mannose-1-phosphate guanylyltransferase
MASIKYLKKYLKSLTHDLKNECLLFLAIHPESKPENIFGIIQEIENIETELIFRINHYKYKPAELSAKQFVNNSIAEADRKLGAMLEKLQSQVK